ncbi:THAP domain-containing protein 9 [Cyphomyrmex costatus]|uniref:THAP domain-containing protein 9 n=1 Tax=Cyphomyrmex costatus TaxID=456900 RepID=A0A151ICJ1_9HYME|nr:THAP domain-containing protein 9 [Cyphomyrmex costatus]
MYCTIYNKEILIKLHDNVLKNANESNNANINERKETYKEAFCWTDASTKLFLSLYKENKDFLVKRKIYKNTVTHNKKTGRNRLSCSYETKRSYSFPTDPESLLWLKVINRTTVSKNSKLCSKHFKARFFRCSSGSNMTQRRFLLPTAIPSLYLCSGSENYIEVTNDQQKNNDNNALFLSVENLKTYFPHSVTKENVWVMLDACHMIKLIRNTFDKQRLINAENKMILWKYLEELVLVQERHNLHVATKIRRRHLNWKQEKMKVKLAVQTLSTSVANALTYLDKECKMSQFKGSEATAQFCLIMNDIFDVLNSRNKFCKTESQKCISKDNFLIIEKKIDNYIKYIVSLKNDENIPILQTERKIGFLGFIICLKSVVGICYQYILSLENKWDYLLTYKMSQDHLELYFSAIRSRGGHNNNPTCRQFQTAFKQLLVHCEIGGSEYANSVPQNTTSFLHASSLIKKDESIDELIDSIPHTNDHEYANVSAEHSYINSETFINCNSVYIDDVVSYIAGFIVKSIKSKISCDICSKMLICESTISSLQKI